MSSLDQVVEQARSALAAGDWGEVVSVCEAAGQEAKQDSRIRDMLAYALFLLGRYADVLAIQGIDEGGRIWAISKDLAAQELSGKHALVWYGPPLDNVAYVSMVKDEADIIFTNLLWHYSIGFRKFVLIDNLSVDNTRQEIDRFRLRFEDALVIVINDPIVAHLQAEFITAGLRVACTLWPEVAWVFAVDADEFLSPERRLGDILKEIPESAHALMLPKSQYVPTLGFNDEAPDAPFFVKLPFRERLSHNSCKVVVRGRHFLEIGQGNHMAMFNGQDLNAYLGGLSLGLHYREFFLRSLDHARSKVVNGGRAVEAAEAIGKKDVGGNHWKAWFDIYQRCGDAAVKTIFESHFRKPEDLIYDPMPIGAAFSRWL